MNIVHKNNLIKKYNRGYRPGLVEISCLHNHQFISTLCEKLNLKEQ